MNEDTSAQEIENPVDDAVAEPQAQAETEARAEAAAAELSEEEKAERLRQLIPIVEGALLAAGETLSLNRIQALFDEHEVPSKGLLTEVLQHIQASCDGRGYCVVEVASGWRFQVREDYAPWVNRLWDEKPQKYSRALLETLALIAYRQPLTRGDIEEVRGVAVSSHIIKTLTEREWVKVVGHRDVPGRPALYATTRQFLDYFGLKSLDELPTLGELKDIDSLNESLDLQAQEGGDAAPDTGAAADASTDDDGVAGAPPETTDELDTSDTAANAEDHVDDQEPESSEESEPSEESDDLPVQPEHLQDDNTPKPSLDEREMDPTEDVASTEEVKLNDE